MRSARLARVAAIGGALALTLLAACTPTLDWRELRAPEAGFSVMLPGRIATDARALPAPLADVRLSQWSARAGETLYAVGVAGLPSADRGKAVAALLRTGLMANFGARVTAEYTLAGGWTEWAALGTAAGKEVRVDVRQRILPDRYQQLVVIAPVALADREAVQMFWSSFRPLPGT